MKRITDDIAREIVTTRMNELATTGRISPAREFALELRKNGVANISLGTLRHLLAGRLIPKLTDKNGVPIDWSKMPRRCAGRPVVTPEQVAARVAMERRVYRLEAQVKFVFEHLGLQLPDPLN